MLSLCNVPGELVHRADAAQMGGGAGNVLELHGMLYTLLRAHGKDGVCQHIDVEFFRVIGRGHPLHGLLHPGDFRPAAQERLSHLKGKL